MHACQVDWLRQAPGLCVTLHCLLVLIITRMVHIVVNMHIVIRRWHLLFKGLNGIVQKYTFYSFTYNRKLIGLLFFFRSFFFIPHTEFTLCLNSGNIKISSTKYYFYVEFVRYLDSFLCMFSCIVVLIWCLLLEEPLYR